MKTIQMLNEGFDKRYGLDEALPKDLMTAIRQADGSNGRYSSNKNRDMNRFNTSDSIYNYRTYDAKTDSYVDTPKSYVKDFENATYKEITPAEVIKMKKAGEDLSNVYIMRKGSMIALNDAGYPSDTRSSIKGLRSNQSIKTSLEGADKIYVAEIPDALDTQPEKMKARMADREQRNANTQLGKERPEWSDEGRRNSNYVKALQRKGGNSAEIAAIRQSFEDGDISRKEMEKRIDSLKSNVRISDYDVRGYNNIRNRNAEARNFASNQALQKPFNDLSAARSDLYHAKNDLARKENELNKIKGDDISTYNSYGSYNYALEQVQKLKRQIASLQADLDRYQAQIDSGAKDKDIQKTEKEIESDKALIAASQDKIDTLLRRK